MTKPKAAPRARDTLEYQQEAVRPVAGRGRAEQRGGGHGWPRIRKELLALHPC